MNLSKLTNWHLLEKSRDHWLKLNVQYFTTNQHLQFYNTAVCCDKFQQSVGTLQVRYEIRQKGKHETGSRLFVVGRQTPGINVIHRRSCVSSSWQKNVSSHHATEPSITPQTLTCWWLRFCKRSPICGRRYGSTLGLSLTESVTLLHAKSLNFVIDSTLRATVIVRSYRGQTRSRITHDARINHDVEMDEMDNNSSEKISSLSAVYNSQGHDGDQDLTQEDDVAVTEHRSVMVKRKPVDEMTLPELSRSSFNIVPYVKRSVTLQNLVRIGVNLDKIQKVPGVAEFLIKSDFSRDIVPFLKFLALVGIEKDKVGHIFTANPLLFLESVQDLQVRIGYLLHKNFTLPEVAAMVTRDPIVLLMDPLMLDEKLGFLQDVFRLTAHQVRQVVKACPKLLPWKTEPLRNVRFHLKEFMGFTDQQIQQLILKNPFIFMSDKDTLVSRFDYLYNHMMISHEHIITWPNILTTRRHIIQTRHMFLLHLGRAQYDPCKECYVSLRALVSGTDEEFCQTVAKCSVQEYFDFCKTL